MASVEIKYYALPRPIAICANMTCPTNFHYNNHMCTANVLKFGWPYNLICLVFAPFCKYVSMSVPDFSG